MSNCKYCGATVSRKKICKRCEKRLQKDRDCYSWILSVDLETVTVERGTLRPLKAEEIYNIVKVQNEPENVLSIISFGCAGLFNLTTGEQLYFDGDLKLSKVFPSSHAITYSSDFDRVIYATRDYIKNRYKWKDNDDCIPFTVAWHNGNSYDLSFFHSTDFYNAINWEKCKGTNLHNLKIITMNDYNGVRLRVIDTYKLFSCKLSKLGDDIGLEKLDGSETYERAPVPPTPPTASQLRYCFRDVEIVGKAILYYAQENKDNWKSPFDIPATSTGRVRAAVKNNTGEKKKTEEKKETEPGDDKNDGINLLGVDVQEIYSKKYDTPVKAKYKSNGRKDNDRLTDWSNVNNNNFYKLNYGKSINLVMSSFVGGITYYNFETLGKVFQNVDSFDFSSHYPSTMLMSDFPSFQWRYYTRDNDELEGVKRDRAEIEEELEELEKLDELTREQKRDRSELRDELIKLKSVYPITPKLEQRAREHLARLIERCDSFELLTDTIDGRFFIYDVVFTNLRAKRWNGCAFPFIKADNKNFLIDTARYGSNICTAVKYRQKLTDIQIATMSLAYTWDKLDIIAFTMNDKQQKYNYWRVSNSRRSKNGKKPKPCDLELISNINPLFITAISHFAKEKTKYKDLEEQLEKSKGINDTETIEARNNKSLAKARLNSLYGNTAQNKLNYDVIIMEDGEPLLMSKRKYLLDYTDFEYDEECLDFSELISYAAGTGWAGVISKNGALNKRYIAEYVTAYARYYLVYFAAYVISHSLGTILYCDTDSIKVHWNGEREREQFLKQCQVYRDAFEKNCKNNPLTAERWDNVCKLGKFDYEHTYSEFCVLGNKRYIFKLWNKEKQRYDVNITFAGFSRKNIGKLGNVFQYDVAACDGSLIEFMKRSGVRYHLAADAKDNGKLEPIRCNVGELITVNERGTFCGNTLCPNGFKSSDIELDGEQFDDERFKEYVGETCYTFGTIAKEAGIYPGCNTIEIVKPKEAEELNLKLVRA